MAADQQIEVQPFAQVQPRSGLPAAVAGRLAEAFGDQGQRLADPVFHAHAPVPAMPALALGVGMPQADPGVQAQGLERLVAQRQVEAGAFEGVPAVQVEIRREREGQRQAEVVAGQQRCLQLGAEAAVPIACVALAHQRRAELHRW